MSKDFIEDEEIVDWTTIDEYQAEGTTSGLSMALAECYKLLNYLLTEQGYEGKDLHENIKNASERFSDLTALMSAIDIYQSIFEEYDQKVARGEAENAIGHFKEAILDIAGSEPQGIGAGKSIRNWFTRISVDSPGLLRRLVIWILIIILGSILLDTTHFGQKLVHWIASLIYSWVFTGIVVLIITFIVVTLVIAYLERRKRGK